MNLAIIITLLILCVNTGHVMSFNHRNLNSSKRFQIESSGHLKKKISMDSIVFEGKVLDKTILSLPNEETELNIFISKYPFSRILMSSAEHLRYQIKVKYNRKFKLRLPFFAKRYYMSIYYKSNNVKRTFSDITNIYILEKGANINCVLSTDMFRFMGKGSAKLNCQSELKKTIINLNNWSTLFNARQFDQLAVKYNQLLDSCLQVQKMIIKKFKPVVGEEFSKIMLANCYGMRYFSLLWAYRNQADNLPFYKGFINSSYYKNIDKNTKLDIKNELLVQAPLYTDFLFEKIMMNTRSIKYDVVEKNTTPEHIMRSYNLIVTNYKGIIRDKLLATFFLQWQTVPTIMTYFEKSMILLNDNIYKEIVSKIYEKNHVGQTFYPFNLLDTAGRFVRLQDLQQKVLIVDFWYTGCVGCINLKRSMEGVWEKYRSDPQVSFVSISIDKQLEKWKQSILTKLYTDPSNINLYTGGEGDNHPIIKKLEIAAYPRMYLLKDGKLFSGTLPWPSGPDTTKGTTKDFINLMEAALKD